MPDKNHEETTVNEGLAKIHEASEQLTEEQIEQLAEDAKAAARENAQKHTHD
ncbi:hypothetical protein [Yersinia intermedia]|jgi:hypothetical protein|uniref:Uncharacterized protein n=1 Tax=Yersinia intermedia TaxID=631 RepID=A0A0T9LRU9_YERIN|nr:hypothetical protein [Yersinia intermedia]MCB5310976.1 hypothetical protein [Yersinia intermedia]MCB5323488.1 hypothetical protein [Yersinia intermedia]MCB5326749.1 hypothetical protein [Yersinia intermedia]UNK21832.1 hypothetical protein MNQ97_13430 [Yersinia intermedia]UZM69475.1 hypothetical protein OP861_12745 [Yersinia intermedia]